MDTFTDSRHIHSDILQIGDDREKILYILKYGVRAPSTHNSQPWLFKIKKNVVEVFIDPKIQIREADKVGRDLYISLGCLLENVVQAAKAFGVFKKISYFPSKNLDHVATIHFQDNLIISNIDTNVLDSIIGRINVRGVFSNIDIDYSRLTDLISRKNDISSISTIIVRDKQVIRKLAQLTGHGLRQAYQNKMFRREMSQWFRTNLSNKHDGLPGYSLSMPTLISLVFPLLVRYVDIGSKVSELNYKSFMSTQAVCVLATKEDNVQTWVEVGMLAEKLMLSLYSCGYRTSIFVAAIEIGDLRNDLKRALSIDLNPQFLFCIGMMDTSDFRYTPRHSPVEKLL